MILTVTANPAIDKVYFVKSFAMGEVHRPLSVTQTAGGKGLNVSRVAKTLGTPVTAMGFLGGSAGGFIRQQVRELGISDLFTPIAGQTRTCINITDASGISGEILEPGPEVTSADDFLVEYDRQLDNCTVVCVSGSLPKGLTSAFYTELIRRANAEGRRIIVDTSGSVMLDILDAAPFMVKPNRDELAQLLGRTPNSDEDVACALRLLKDRGVAVPLATLGASGAMALIDDRLFRFVPPSVAVKNAVGSGDSTVAGIAVGLCRGLSVQDAIRLGVASGTANTQFQQTGTVTQALVTQYYRETMCLPF